MLLFDFILKKRIIKILFGNKNLIRNTFMDTIVNTLKVIFDKEIIIDMMRAMISQVFYLGITSFGIIFLGCVILTKLLKKYKNNEISSDKNLLIMGIFSIVGTIFLVLTTIFFFSTIFKNGTSFIFGRYNDTLSSMIIFFVIITTLKKKSELENIYYVFSSLLIIGIPFLLIEPMNEANSKIGDVSLLTLLSFVPGNKFNSPEKLYMVTLFLLMISIYMLVSLNKKILLSIFTGIMIYVVSNINLSYIRINTDNKNFSIIKNKYEILNKIPSQKFSLNVVRDFYTDYYSYVYIMLFHNYNVNYQTKDIVESILSGTEEYSIARKEQESLFIDKNIYKVIV